MKKLLMLCSLVVMLVGIMSFSATAAQMSGALSFSGHNVVDTASLLDAHAFMSFNGVTITDGDGTWAGVTNSVTPASFYAFTFAPAPVPNFKVWNFDYAGDTFTMNALGSTVHYTTGTFNDDYGLTVWGLGTISATGTTAYEATPGSWVITANQAGTTFSFSASSRTTVPEPGILMLLGFGLVGVAGAVRKFRK